MQLSKIKKNFKNYSAGLLVKLATLVSQLLLVPIYIKTLGVSQYGEWLIITSIPNYLLMSDLGLTVTITNEICKLNTLNSFEKAKELFKSTNSLLVLIGLLLIFVFILIASFINISDTLGLKVINEVETERILFIYLLNIIITILFNFNLGQFKANNKFYKYEFFNSFLYFFDFLTTAAVLFLKSELFFIPLLLIFNRILFFFIVKWDLTKFDNYSYGFSRNLALSRRLIPTSLSYTMFTLGYAFFLQGNTFVVGLKLGSSQVVIFNSIRTLVNSVKAFVGILYLPTMPEFTILITQKLKNNARKKLSKLLLIVFVAALVMSLSIYYLRSMIFKTWLGDGFIYSQAFLGIMLLSIIFQTLWNAESMVPLSINKNKKLALFPILGLLNLVIQYLFLDEFGLIGTAISLVVMDIVLFIYIYILSIKIIRH